MNEVQTFLNAIQFYTRIPLRNLVGFTPARAQNSIRYFPLIGTIVGGLAAAAIDFTQPLVGTDIAVILGLGCSVLITGGLHEDGFADFCDGFGGGKSKDHILKIMSDSSIGVYASIGLIFMFMIKFTTLSKLFSVGETCNTYILLIAAHVISRSSSGLIMFFLPYSKPESNSKAKPMTGKLSVLNGIVLFWFIILGAGLVVFAHGLQLALILIVCTALITWLTTAYFKNKIEGYTGDTLGANQQIVEVLVYLIFIGFENYAN